MEAQAHRVGVLRAETFLHDLGVAAAERAELSDLLEKIRLADKEKGKAGRRPVKVAIAMVLAYISLNLVITRVANEKLAMCSECGGPPEAVFASPPPVEFWK